MWPADKKERVSAVLTSDFTSDDERVEPDQGEPYRETKKFRWESQELRAAKAELEEVERTMNKRRGRRGGVRRPVVVHPTEHDKRLSPPAGAPEWTIR